MPGPLSEKVRMSRIASSPISNAVNPASVYVAAPSSPAPITARDQPLARALVRHRSIADSQGSGSPTGFPLARLTEPITREETPRLGSRGVASVPDNGLVPSSGEVA